MSHILIYSHPVRELKTNYKVLKDAVAPREIRRLSSSEAEKVLRTAYELFPELYSAILTAPHTGARVGEIRGFKWADIDFNKRQILIARSKDAKDRVSTPKNGTSRYVQLTEFELQRLKKEVQSESAGNEPGSLEPLQRLFATERYNDKRKKLRKLRHYFLEIA